MPVPSSIPKTADDRPLTAGSQGGSTLIEGVPEAHQQAAEEVRAHLVALRGGAPFLSPADAQVLVGWLDDAVPVAAILCALERCEASRRKRRSRLPVSLVAAKRHLGRPLPAPKPARALTGLAALAADLRASTSGDPHAEALLAVADDLEALPPGEPDAILRAALDRVRAFLDAVWGAMPADERARRLTAAAEVFADLDDEAAAATAAEAMARGTLRADYPLLTAAALWHVVQA